MQYFDNFKHKSYIAYAALTLSAFFFSSNHIIGRSIYNEIPPVGLSFWRWVTGILILLPFFLYTRKAPITLYLANIKQLSILGATMIGGTTLTLIALNFTTAINVSLINAFQPTITIIFACIFLKDVLTKNRILGICSGVIGVIIMISKGKLEMLAGLQFNLGDLIALTAMCGFGIYTINFRNLSTEFTTIESLFGITVVGTSFLLPFYIVESIFYITVPFSISTIVVVLILALTVSVLGNIMWNTGIHIIGPSHATMFINLVPIFGAILAIVFLNEHLFLYHIIGGILICLGIWFVVSIKSQSELG